MGEFRLTPRLRSLDHHDHRSEDRFEASERAYLEGVDREERERRVAEAFRALSLEERERILGIDNEGDIADA